MECIKTIRIEPKCIDKSEKSYFTNAVKQWVKIKKDIRLNGESGYTHIKLDFSDGAYLDRIFYRDATGRLLGFIQYFQEDNWGEKTADLRLLVNPKYWRQGIGTKLLEEAFRIWPIDIMAQTYNPCELKFLFRYLNSHLSKP